MRGLAAIVWLLALGCSTLAPKPEPSTCTNNADCPSGTVCFTGFCQNSEVVPPQIYVGFNLEEAAQGGPGYRVEVAGCDIEVELDTSTGLSALAVPRDRMTYDLALRVFKTADFDPNAPTVEDMLVADFELTQSSRFARGELIQTASAPNLEGDADVLPTPIRWPRYFPNELVPPLPEDLGPRGHILWKVEPKEPVAEHVGSAAHVYVNLTPPVADGFPECEPEAIEDQTCKMLRTCSGLDEQCCETPPCEEPEEYEDACVPPGAHDGLTSGVCRAVDSQPLRYDVAYVAECDRAVRAEVVRATPDLQPGEYVVAADFTLRYANNMPSRLGLPVFADWWPNDVPECERDFDCVENTQFCNRTTNKCEVALAGLQAAGGSIVDETGLGQIEARVFTYCDPATNVPVDRAYTVRIDPPVDSGLFPMSYAVDATFDPPTGGGDPSPVDLGGGKAFCLPDLGTLSVVRVLPQGSPKTVLATEAGEYRCCDLDCLPTDEAGVPPPTPSSCPLAGATMTASAPIEIDVSAWSEDGSLCAPPVLDDDGSLGVLSRTAACSTNADEGCLLSSLPLAYAQEYAVRIESPTGSVLQSADTTITMAPDTTDIVVPLEARPIVRGRVVLSSALCDPSEEDDGDCGSEGAQVLAERLRVGNETTANTPGPYFHQVETFHDPDRGDGAYVLPLDPGWWIMTALPDPGTAGGPATYALVELGPEGEFDQPFTLEPGILVTLDLATFDRRSLIIPLDIGSWTLQPNLETHPDREAEIDPTDRLLDLMAPGECLATDPTRGCSIRRLVAGTGLSPSQVGQVRFTARDVGSDSTTVCAF